MHELRECVSGRAQEHHHAPASLLRRRHRARALSLGWLGKRRCDSHSACLVEASQSVDGHALAIASAVGSRASKRRALRGLSEACASSDAARCGEGVLFMARRARLTCPGWHRGARHRRFGKTSMMVMLRQTGPPVGPPQMIVKARQELWETISGAIVGTRRRKSAWESCVNTITLPR